MNSPYPLPTRSGWPLRYNLIALCFFASFICYIDRVNLSVAVIVMQERFGWSETTKGLVMSSFFWGYLAMQVPAGWLANRIGGKRVLTFAVAWWSIFTILTPAAALISLPVLLATRVSLGLGEAATYPSTYNLFQRWIPNNERSRAVAIVLSGLPMGTMLASMVSGWMVERFGWPSVFYAFGLVGLVWALIWHLEIHDHPLEHPRLGESERQLLTPLQGDTAVAAKPPVPWRKLLSQPGVWAIVINHFCSNWALYMLVAWLPSYFHKVQHLTTTRSGLYSAAPWFTMFLMSNVAGWLADGWLKRGMAPLIVRRIMQTIGMLGPAAFLFLAKDATSANQAVLLISVATGLFAFAWSGFAANHHEIAPKYADVLLGISNTAGTLPGAFGVAITGWLIQISGSYSSAFVVAAGVSVTGWIVWLLFATSDKVVD
jgi:ACS family sodium-dependent inorganic phosphate cotransporter